MKSIKTLFSFLDTSIYLTNRIVIWSLWNQIEFRFNPLSDKHTRGLERRTSFFLISINCLENSYYVVTYKKPALVGKLARLMMPALKLRGSEATSLFAFGLVCFISTVDTEACLTSIWSITNSKGCAVCWFGWGMGKMASVMLCQSKLLNIVNAAIMIWSGLIYLSKASLHYSIGGYFALLHM